jgi:hypothetical protein
MVNSLPLEPYFFLVTVIPHVDGVVHVPLVLSMLLFSKEVILSCLHGTMQVRRENIENLSRY